MVLDIKKSLQGAIDEGLLSPAAMQMNSTDLGLAFNDAMGCGPDAIDGDFAFMVFVLLDDSYSIEMKHNTDHVRLGYNTLIQELQKSNNHRDMIITTWFLNGGVFQAPTPIDQAKKLGAEYYPNGGTPLYRRTTEMALMGALKCREFTKTGMAFKAMLIVIGDGKDECDPSGKKVTAKQCNAELTLLQAETFQAIGYGISDGETDFDAVFKSMGLKLTLTSASDGHAIREAFGTISRATATASQGGTVSQADLGGFGAD